jgi:hypothetical protein
MHGQLLGQVAPIPPHLEPHETIVLSPSPLIELKDEKANEYPIKAAKAIATTKETLVCVETLEATLDFVGFLFLIIINFILIT